MSVKGQNVSACRKSILTSGNEKWAKWEDMGDLKYG